MPRRSMLTAVDREYLLTLPESDDELIRHYSFSETDRALIRLRRSDANRLGFAVQLCLLRYPGHALAADRDVPEVLIDWVSTELWLDGLGKNHAMIPRKRFWNDSYLDQVGINIWSTEPITYAATENAR